MTLNAAQTAELTTALARYDLEQLGDRLRRAIERERRGGNARPDGWPKGHTDGPGSGAKVTVADEDGNPDTISVTSVELAIIARERPVRDELRDLVDSAIRRARAALTELARLDGLLLGIDHLAGKALDDTEPGCASCARYIDAAGRAWFSPRFRGDLCQWCYGWVNDTEANPTRRLPPVPIIERRARGDRITTADLIRASRKTAASTNA